MQAPDGNIRFFDEDLTHERCLEEGLMAIPKDELEETVNMHRQQRKNWMRNKPCICKSGKKFKQCCWNNYS